MQATPETVWEYLQEVGKQLKEVGERLDKVGERLDKVGERLDKVGEEIEALKDEMERRSKETDRQMRETDKKIKELSNLFTTQWGKLVEALVEPGVLDLFRKQGIKIKYTTRRLELEDENGRKIAEFDILLVNDEEAVVIEVKTTVKKEDVDYFLEKLGKAREWVSLLRMKKRIYGAVAGLSYDEGVDRYAYRQGLFVLKSEGGIIKIANDENFIPKIW